MARPIKEINIDLRKMTRQEKIQTAKELSKRANVRLQSLQANKYDIDIKTQKYLENKGVNNKFYRGSSYNSTKELNQTLKQLQTFLTAPTSSVQSQKKTKPRAIQSISVADIKTTPKEDLGEIARRMAIKANARIRTLEKKGVQHYAIAGAKQYTGDSGKFYTGRKFATQKELQLHIQELEKFLNAKSSTIKGLTEINDRRIEVLQTKYNLQNKDKAKFTEFLQSAQFKDMRGKYTSDFIFDNTARALEQGTTLEQIMSDYNTYIQQDLTPDQIQQKMKTEKWQYDEAQRRAEAEIKNTPVRRKK